MCVCVHMSTGPSGGDKASDPLELELYGVANVGAGIQTSSAEAAPIFGCWVTFPSFLPSSFTSLSPSLFSFFPFPFLPPLSLSYVYAYLKAFIVSS